MSDQQRLDRAYALWPRALDQAHRACGRTLARLRRGDGGFYEADDLLQDLFCAWVDLALERGDDEDALWRAWSGLLYAGGRQIIRRPPQRLWSGREDAVSDAALADASAVDHARRQNAALRWRTVCQALWGLSIAQRQVIYWRAIRGESSLQVARHLGADTATIDTRLSRARTKLRDILAEKEAHP